MLLLEVPRTIGWRIRTGLLWVLFGAVPVLVLIGVLPLGSDPGEVAGRMAIGGCLVFLASVSANIIAGPILARRSRLSIDEEFVTICPYFKASTIRRSEVKSVKYSPMLFGYGFLSLDIGRPESYLRLLVAPSDWPGGGRVLQRAVENLIGPHSAAAP